MSRHVEINEIVLGKRGTTAEAALRLGRYFSMSAKFWINLHSHYDLEMKNDKIGERLESEVKVHSEASRIGKYVFSRRPENKGENQ